MRRARGQALATEPWSGPVTSARTVRPSPTSAAWTWSGEEYRRPTRQCDGHSTEPLDGSEANLVPAPGRGGGCSGQAQETLHLPGVLEAGRPLSMRVAIAVPWPAGTPGRASRGRPDVMEGVSPQSGHACPTSLPGDVTTLSAASRAALDTGKFAAVPAVHDRTSTCRAARSSREPAPSSRAPPVPMAPPPTCRAGANQYIGNRRCASAVARCGLPATDSNANVGELCGDSPEEGVERRARILLEASTESEWVVRCLEGDTRPKGEKRPGLARPGRHRASALLYW